MTDPAEAAAVLDESTASASGETVPKGDEQTAEGDTADESEPGGVKRFFRTDKSLDLDDATPWWDPRGKGGLNRIGAAIKQAGGWERMFPAFWILVGMFEVLYLFVVDRELVPSRSSSDESDESDDEPSDDSRPEDKIMENIER